MSTLSTLTPIDHALVSRHLQRLRRMSHLQVRRDYLASLLRTEGDRTHDLVQKCFAEEWEQRKDKGAKA
ncbi:MAG: hypothetical protein HY855_02865 [Burkholderiales bacterium]|nr:hypothetical protein [Burkholderiales bacterium]